MTISDPPAHLPRQVGITGGIGSGKSLVCRLFALVGIPVYDADSRARWVMHHHAGLRQEIQARFGLEVYHPNGALNRPYLAARVFNQSDQVAELNALVHPKVAEDYAAWVLAHPHAPYLLKEAALLYEAGSYQLLHHIVVVSAPVDLRLRRVQQRDPHRTEAEIRAIMGKQLSEDERLHHADSVIYNDDTQLVVPQVLHLHANFLRQRILPTPS